MIDDECRERSAPNFNLVMEALQEHTRVTGRQPMSVSGWEVEDREIRPPETLVERLRTIPSRLESYTYARELGVAKERAAEVFHAGVRFDGEPLKPAQVASLQNSTQALLVALATLKDRGVRHAVIAAPSYFAAVEICRRLGFTLTIVPTVDFLTGALDISRIAAVMRKQLSVLILTNPAYSVGVEYGIETLKTLFAALPDNAYTLLDETRLGLHWRNEAPWYAAEYPANVLVVRSPSKIFLVNGLKTSFIFGAAQLISEIDLLSEALLGSAMGNAEQVALAYLDCWQAWRDEVARAKVGPLRRWRRRVIERLQTSRADAAELLEGRGFVLSPVESGPYVLAGATAAAGARLNSQALAREVGVLMMDSTYFFHQSEGWQGFRVNLFGDQCRVRAALESALPRVGAP